MNNIKVIKKGEKTAQKILEEAEKAFSNQGFDASSMRYIAEAAGIKAAGIYKYHDSKETLYTAVLENALQPIKILLDEAVNQPSSEVTGRLPERILDIFHDNPNRAALFLQTMRTSESSTSIEMINTWLDEFLRKGAKLAEHLSQGKLSQDETALLITNLFNLCAGFYMAEPMLNRVWSTSATSEKNLACQKLMVNHFLQGVLTP